MYTDSRILVDTFVDTVTFSYVYGLVFVLRVVVDLGRGLRPTHVSLSPVVRTVYTGPTMHVRPEPHYTHVPYPVSHSVRPPRREPSVVFYSGTGTYVDGK